MLLKCLDLDDDSFLYPMHCIGASKIFIHSPYFPATGIFKSSFFSFSQLFKFSVKTKQSKILVKIKNQKNHPTELQKQELHWHKLQFFIELAKIKKEENLGNFVKINWKNPSIFNCENWQVRKIINQLQIVSHVFSNRKRISFGWFILGIRIR